MVTRHWSSIFYPCERSSVSVSTSRMYLRARPQISPLAGSGLCQKAGYEQPPASEYALVYEGALVCEVQQDDAIRLKLVAARYSGELPADYHGRSVSPSTVIEFFDENGRRYFYCDGNDKFLPVKFSPKLAKDKRERH